MKYKILVAGGTGFLGSNLIKKLLNKNIFEVYCLSQCYVKKQYRNVNIKYIFCSVQEKKKLKNKLNFKFDFVINFAGHPNHNEKNNVYITHYLGLKNLVEIMLRKKIKKFIQIGSSVEYGFIRSPQKESDNCQLKNQKSVFGKSKLKATKYLLSIYKKKKFPVIIVRPYLIYGPGQSVARVIPSSIINLIQNNQFNLTSGNQIRNFLYVNDFVNIIIKILFLNRNGEILNVGSVKNYSVKSIITKIHKLIKKGYLKFGNLKLRNDEPKELYPSLTKLKKFIKLDKETSINDGLKETIKYYKKLKYE